MSQGYGHVGGHSSGLQRRMHQRFPQHWLSAEPSSCARSQAPNTPSHVSVVLYQMLLHDAAAAAWTGLRAFPLQYRILFAYKLFQDQEVRKGKESEMEEVGDQSVGESER